MGATITSVGEALGRKIAAPDEIAQVNFWIKGAELLIKRRLGPLEGLDAEAVEYVISQAVARRALNPEGKRTERIDDYSYTLSADSAAAEITITDLEWAMLTPDDNTIGGAFSITPTSPTYVRRAGRGTGREVNHDSFNGSAFW